MIIIYFCWDLSSVHSYSNLRQQLGGRLAFWKTACSTTWATFVEHILWISLAFPTLRPHLTLFMHILTDMRLRIKRMFVKVGINPISFLSRSAPLNAMFSLAPLQRQGQDFLVIGSRWTKSNDFNVYGTYVVWTSWLFHSCTDHFEGRFKMMFRLIAPVGRDRPLLFTPSIGMVRPSVRRSVMNKYTAIPWAFEGMGSTMKALWALVE